MVLPVPNSQFVEDDQVVGDFYLVDPLSNYSLGSLYRVTLTGIDPPEVGTILLGRGESPVGGEVVDVQSANGNVVATLKILPVNEMFSSVTINQTFSLADTKLEISKGAADYYEMHREPDGSYRFDLIPNIPISILGSSEKLNPNAAAPAQFWGRSSTKRASCFKHCEDFSACR